MLLIALAAAEVFLLAASLRAGRPLRRTRAAVRIALLAGFGVLVLTGVLEWGPRYYTLAGTLAAFALAGGITLTRRSPDEARHRPVARFAGALLVFALASAPVIVFPQHPPPKATGPHSVARLVEHLTDASRVEKFSEDGRARQLVVEYWYPEASDSTFPLVVFSHGATGVRSSNESLFQELASHGYVVASIDHPYHALITTDAEGRTIGIDSGFLQDLRNEDARKDPAGSLASYRAWMGLRMADLSFLIDYVRDSTDAPGAARPFGLVDADRIGVMGHSLGGSAAVGVGRERDDIGAVIALEAPFMTEIVRVEDGAFVWNDAPYSTPLLNVYSDSSWSHLDDWPQYAQNQRQLASPDPDVHSVHLAGVGHLGLTDLSLTSPLLTRLLDGVPSERSAAENLAALNGLCLRFFDAYLKGSGTFEP